MFAAGVNQKPSRRTYSSKEIRLFHDGTNMGRI
jgi:hypothetical protein